MINHMSIVIRLDASWGSRRIEVMQVAARRHTGWRSVKMEELCPAHGQDGFQQPSGSHKGVLIVSVCTSWACEKHPKHYTPGHRDRPGKSSGLCQICWEIFCILSLIVAVMLRVTRERGGMHTHGKQGWGGSSNVIWMCLCLAHHCKLWHVGSSETVVFSWHHRPLFWLFPAVSGRNTLSKITSAHFPQLRQWDLKCICHCWLEGIVLSQVLVKEGDT